MYGAQIAGGLQGGGGSRDLQCRRSGPKKVKLEPENARWVSMVREWWRVNHQRPASGGETAGQVIEAEVD